MANPTITYGHGFLDDFHTAWTTRNAVNMGAGDYSNSIVHGDWMKITGTFDDGATEEYGYYEYDVSALALPTNTYEHAMMRYKTSVGSAGARAQGIITHTAGGTYDLMLTAPAYSTTWKWVVKKLTPAKTLNKIRLYIWDDGTNGTFDVYYDFAFVYKDVFTWPIHPRMESTIPPRYADIGIPGGSEITQGMGMNLASLVLSGDMELGSGWGNPKGDTLDMIAHGTQSEAWQWFTCNRGHFKVTMRPLTYIDEEGEGAKPRYMVELKEYSLSPLNQQSYTERFGRQ